MQLRTLQKTSIKKNMRIFCRADLNVPSFSLVDMHRVEAVIPDLITYASRGAKIILASHRGNPEGIQKEWSLEPLRLHLERMTGLSVSFSKSQKKSDIDPILSSMNSGEILLLENLRFNPGEERNNVIFAKSLAANADIFVNNAFSVCHRSHASISAITKFLPSFAGRLLTSEVDMLSRPMKKPVVLALGGIKISTKIPLLKAFEPNLQTILVGSGIAALFYAAKVKKRSFGGLRFAKEEIEDAQYISDIYGDRLQLPTVFIVRTKTERAKIIHAMEISSTDTIIDVAPQEILRLAPIFKEASTIIWNGTFGIAEMRTGEKGSLALADLLLHLDAKVIIGGGDTVAFLDRAGLTRRFTHISLGGGAMLAYLAGEKMPGLQPLWKK